MCAHTHTRASRLFLEAKISIFVAGYKFLIEKVAGRIILATWIPNEI